MLFIFFFQWQKFKLFLIFDNEMNEKALIFINQKARKKAWRKKKKTMLFFCYFPTLKN